MKTVCLLINYGVSSDSQVAGRSVSDWISTALEASLGAVPQKSVGPWDNAAAFVESLQGASEGYDEVVLVAVDAPFLRPDLMTEMLALHREYRADYTFADGFPTGLTAEILKPGILPVLAQWCEGKAANRETLFTLLSTDINRFDVETHLSPVDLRSRRLSFTADSRRNLVLLNRYAADTPLSTLEFLNVIESTTARTRTLPATLHVQVTDGVLQTPIWSPVTQFAPQALVQRNCLSRERWNALLDQALTLSGDITVLPSFWGEPSLHPEIGGLLLDAVKKKGIKLCIETSGLGWAGVALEELAPLLRGHVEWIVELDSNDQTTYGKMRGPGFDEAQAFAKRLLALFPGQVWPQTVRMTENEPEMETFYKHWKAEAGRVILQKHNDFGGRLLRAKPSDLSPWKRHACWHLARDLAVFLDGTAVVCRDDFDRTQPLGNVWSESLSQVWERGTPLFERHAREDWPLVCQKCDEWYTFHF